MIRTAGSPSPLIHVGCYVAIGVADAEASEGAGVDGKEGVYGVNPRITGSVEIAAKLADRR